MSNEPGSLSAALAAHIRQALVQAGGWLPFDRFMALALYTPGLGYYSRGAGQLGWWPGAGSDFVTAPELSPLFGQTLAAQVQQVLEATGTHTVVEFGAGTGALAEQVLETLGERVREYGIVEVSGGLRGRQQQRLARFGARVRWHEQWPEAIRGVVLGNEVLDAMPVQLITFDGERWLERGVAAGPDGAWAFADRPTPLQPPVAAEYAPGHVTELHAQACAFMAGLATRLEQGVALFIDYGFPEAEYHLPQRHGGTLMCHRAHRADADPLADVGSKDITAHVDFTAVALAAQDAGLQVLGYTSQGRFLLNCGLAPRLAQADVPARSAALKLVHEHEMGELFKVLALGRGVDLPLLGFAAGDRCHQL